MVKLSEGCDPFCDVLERPAPSRLAFAMPHARAFVRLTLLLLLAGAVLQSQGAEPWSDPRLPMTNGLALWFDLPRQNAARGANGQSPLRSWNDAADLLFDGSGHRRNAVQPLLAARPAFYQWQATALRFDGSNDFLSLTTPGWRMREATVFVVANPQQVGAFTGLLAASERGRNDYLTGLNLDFGGNPSPELTHINVEGTGFSGEADLLKSTSPLNRWHIFTLAAGTGPQGVRFFLDGQPRGTRDRADDSTLAFEQFVLGARFYSNTPDRPHVQGFFSGELTEVILFDRVLPEVERVAVERYLEEKYGVLLRGMDPLPVKEGAVPLITVTNPPPVQVHFPGFSVTELPVELNNVNNVRYRPDGKLVAVGYDGRIWLLDDADDDGLEERATLFHDGAGSIRGAIGAALTPPGYPRGDGLFIAAKDRLVLLVDTNRDDRADEVITVATWKERSEQQGVDALGVALGADGSVYFSLGAASFTEPFLIDKGTGEARYRTTLERGTIQRVSPDFSRRETVCSGIRFAVGLAFNRAGDLFATDQEGATWRHDGNPFDELLLIEAGRHYGFPPHHPRHLPLVVDEPSVFDYAPQHQSTCGLQFNESVNSGPVFGPSAWTGDAFVAGYSRGKLWRTRLVKTAPGYVAETHLLATLQSLTVDACVSPRGDLIVASHGGLPDWGSGPNGRGHLWRVRYARPEAPQPVAAWNASPTELVVAFDRPLEPELVKGLARRSVLESGRFVFAGDRFETIRPGYQVVYDQLAAPRHRHEILGVQASPDRRTLTWLTVPRTSAVNYALTLPELGRSHSSPDDPEPTDLLTSLNGVEARWESADGREQWSGWIPHVDLQAARELTVGSARHDQLFALLTRPGSLTLRGQLDLWQMLQPAIQPGAAIDWERPTETVRVHFESNGSLDGTGVALTGAGSGRREAEFVAPGERWQPFELRLPTGRSDLTLTASWSTAADPERPRPFPLCRFLVPWARPASSEIPTGPREIPEISGGNWEEGRQLFFSAKLACATCHSIHGEGIAVGPDLSNLVQRDYLSVRKDIEFPNAAINPDHVASVLELADDEPLTAIIQSEQDGVLHVVTAGGAVREIPQSRVRSVAPASLSLMPEELWSALTPVEQRNLMTFLLTHPPKAEDP